MKENSTCRVVIVLDDEGLLFQYRGRLYRAVLRKAENGLYHLMLKEVDKG